jgi:biotin carboxyl carrier protein
MKFIAKHDGDEFPVEVERHHGGYIVKLRDRVIEADLVNAGPFVRSLRLGDGTQFALIHHRSGSMHEITLADSTIHVEINDPLALRRKRREDETSAGGAIKALMPGRIVRVLVKPGDRVAKGAGLLILEAMKMENEIQAPADGVVDAVHVEPGQTVDAGAELVEISVQVVG